MTEGKIKLAQRIYAGLDLTTRKAERKLRFIEAGIKIIGNTGFRSATLRALCNEAGLTERYFYESFQSTEGLFLAVLDHLTMDIKQRLLALIQSHSQPQENQPADAIDGLNTLNNADTIHTPADQTTLARLALSLYFTEVRNPVFARITLIEVLGVSPAVDQKYIENTREFSRLVTQIIRAIEPGIRIEPQDEDIVSTALVGAIVTAATGWMLQGYPYSIEQMVNNCLQILTGTARQLTAAKLPVT